MNPPTPSVNDTKKKTIMNKIKMIEVLKMVADDVRNDATDFDGKPFTGKTVGEYMGNHGAAIAAVANVLREMLEKDI